MDTNRDTMTSDDLSSLAWVQEELRKSLEGAHKALRRFLKESEGVAGSDVDDVDPAVLRTARQQLHQGVGALELVGLPAAANLLRASEAAVQRYIQKPQKLNAAAVETIERASFGLLDFLARVLAGKPVSPVSLFPQYRAVQELAGSDRIHPADLWAVDWRWSELPAARDAAARSADDSARAELERLLLSLMRNVTPDVTASQMSDLCAGLGLSAPNLQAGTFWKLASAFFEALAKGHLKLDVYSKRVASRILAQFGMLGRGESAVSDRLAQDLLFFCAQCGPVDASAAPRLAAVQSVYGLASHQPVDYEVSHLGRFDPALLTQARKRVGAAKDSWSAVAGGEMHRMSSLNEQFSLVGDSLRRIYPAGDALAEALQQAVSQTVSSNASPPASLAMEVATSVLYLEASLEDVDFDQPEQEGRTKRLADRIESVRQGQSPAPLESWMEDLYRRVSDRQTMGSVVQELRASLTEAEKSIDSFFRDPSDRSVLSSVPGQLAAMRGVLSVLGMDQASQAVLKMREVVDEFIATEVDPVRAAEAGTFDRLAGNLGALGFLIDMLSYQPQMAKSLFSYNAETGELQPVMGRAAREEQAEPQLAVTLVEPRLLDQAQALAETAARVSTPLEEVSDGLRKLSQEAIVADQPALAATLSEARAAVEQGDLTDAQVHAVREQVAQAVADFVATASDPVGLDEPASTKPAAPAPVMAGSGLEEDDEMREIFLEEAREVMGNALAALEALQSSPDDLEQLTTVRRAFHTLKGSSRMVGLNDFGEAGWACEQLYNAWLAEQKPASDDLRAVTADVLSYLGAWIEEIAARSPITHESMPVRQVADTLRLEGRRTELQPPVVSVPDVQELLVAESGDQVETLAAGEPELSLDDLTLPESAVAEPAAAEPEPAIELSALPDEFTLPELAAPESGDQIVDEQAPAALLDEPLALPEAVDTFELPALSEEALPEGWPQDAELDTRQPAEAPLSAAGGPELSVQSFELDLSGFDGGAAVPADVPVAPAGEPVPTDWELGLDATVGELQVDTPSEAKAGTDASMQALSLPGDATDEVRLDLPAAAEPIETTPEFAQDLADELTTHAAAPVEAGPPEFEPVAPTDVGMQTEPMSLEEFEQALASDAALPRLDGDFTLDLDVGAPGTAAAEPAVEDVPQSVEPAAVSPWPDNVFPLHGAGAPASEPPPAAEPAEAEAEAEAVADVSDAVEDGNDQVKVVGPLRISIPLFNIYLTEADELSRRLTTEVAEWAMELHRPVGESPIALAHSLAGSSATVGFADLSQLARALEHALMRSQAIGHGTTDEARLFVDVAEDIRRLLHQFAAGFLKEPAPDLLDRLARHEIESARLLEEINARVDRGEFTTTGGGLDTLRGAPDTGDEFVAAQSEDDVLAADGADELSTVQPTDAEPSEPLIETLAEAFDTARPADTEPVVDLVIDTPAQDEVVIEPVASGLMPADFAPSDTAPLLPLELGKTELKALGALERSSEAPLHVTGMPGDGLDIDDDIDAVDAVDADLFPIFEEEAQELLPQLANEVRTWLSRPDDPKAPNACMRTLHTFKGGARLAGAMRLGELAHRLETTIERLVQRGDVTVADVDPLESRVDVINAVFEALRSRDAQAYADATAAVQATPDVAAVLEAPPSAQPLMEHVDLPMDLSLASAPVPLVELPETARELTQADTPEQAAAEATAPLATETPMAAPVEPPTPVAAPRSAPAAVAAAPQEIDWNRFATAVSPQVQPASRAAASMSQAAVRVRPQLLDRLVNQAGEVSITRARLETDVNQIKGSLNDLTDNLERLRQQLRDIELQAETQMASRMEQAKAEGQSFDPLEFDRFTRFQEITRMMAESVNDVATVQRTLQRTLETTEDELAAQARLTRNLQDDLLRTRMVEFEGLSERLYRVVRLAAKETGKQVRLDIVGGSIEVDRGVLDRMTASFEHLLRNCVSHGIETPERRQAAGKEAAGTIVVAVHQEGNEVGIEFRDDGAGLDLPRIRQRAITMGMLSPDATPSDADLANLIFTPGFSTADTVTELAGRGVGMDVVRSDVNAMGGRIETATTSGQGTSFKLVLPLTTAVTQVVMLRCGAVTVGVPANLIEIVRRGSPDELARAYETGGYSLGEQVVPFFWLGALLQSSGRGLETGRTLPVIVIRSAQQRIALHVDEVLGNQEVVVKNLGPQLSRLPGLAGMTLLASGAVALIYNPVALATVYGEQARALTAQAMQPAAEAARQAELRAAAQAAAQTPTTPLVLVVDDSLTVRRVTQRLLVREGYRVALAKDGLDALERLAEELPAVVLSDIEMPRMDGFDLVRNLRGDAQLSHLPVIMITSRIAQKHRDYAAELGVNHYLGKPYSEEELLGLIGRYARSEAVAQVAA